jgi:threonine dehydrogenase-like Zn-dependent dehydrogenase
VPGVYGGWIDKVPFGAVMNRAITIKSGQTHVHKYLRPLLELVEEGAIDPSFVVTHRMSLDEAPQGYDMFLRKRDGCVKIVMDPWATAS